MGFSPGELTRADADKLSRMERMLDQLSRMTATPPLSINKSGYNPIISLGGLNIPLLAEVISVSGSTYTVKRKTRDSTNAVVDLTPVEQIQNVITQDGSVLVVGQLVNIQAIPDWPKPVQFWWATSASGPNSSANCSSLISRIIEGNCFEFAIAVGVGSCSCVAAQTTTMTWDATAEAMVGADYIYGCSPGVTTTNCPDGAPMKYRVIVAGFTGGSTGFNGTYTLTHTTGENWVGTMGGVTATLENIGGDSWNLRLVGSDTVLYTGNPFPDCCADIVLDLDDGGGTTTPPASLTAEPVTQCGLGTPYTPYLDVCNDTCSGPQPRLRLVPATGSGAATITFSRDGCSGSGGQFSTSDPIFCTGTAATDCGDNLVTATVACTCCLGNGTGWYGEGWYCVDGSCQNLTACASGITAGPFSSSEECLCSDLTDVPCCSPDTPTFPVQICCTIEASTVGSVYDGFAFIIQRVGSTFPASDPFFGGVCSAPTVVGPNYYGTATLRTGQTIGIALSIDITNCIVNYSWYVVDPHEADPTECSTHGSGDWFGGYFCAGSGSLACSTPNTPIGLIFATACSGTTPTSLTIHMSDAADGCVNNPPASSFNCLSDGTCIDPGDGSGEFATEAECIASCSTGDCCATELGAHPDLEVVFPTGCPGGIAGDDGGTYTATWGGADWTFVGGTSGDTYHITLSRDELTGACLFTIQSDHYITNATITACNPLAASSPCVAGFITITTA